MKKLTVSKNAYYQNQWEHKGYLITELTDGAYLIWQNDNVIKVCHTSIEAAEYIDKITAPKITKVQEYYFIKNENNALFTEVRLSNTTSASFITKSLYLKAVAFVTKESATKYIEKYLEPYLDTSKLEPVALLVNKYAEKDLNVCMFLDIQ